jgi:hypothetical protein
MSEHIDLLIKTAAERIVDLEICNALQPQYRDTVGRVAKIIEDFFFFAECYKEGATEGLICPFCKNKGFNAVSLKDHLSRHCTHFDETKELI